MFTLQTYPSKGVQKDILKVLNITKSKIWHRCFDNNLHEIFRTKILRIATDRYF